MGGEAKPYEVELLIAEVGHGGPNGGGLELYHILYDGSIVDEHDHVVIGGETEPITQALDQRWRAGADRDEVLRACVAALSEAAGRELTPDTLEVSGLDGTRPRRRFFRLRDEPLLRALQG
jgi:proteasome alpha subunit